MFPLKMHPKTIPGVNLSCRTGLKFVSNEAMPSAALAERTNKDPERAIRAQMAELTPKASKKRKNAPVVVPRIANRKDLSEESIAAYKKAKKAAQKAEYNKRHTNVPLDNNFLRWLEHVKKTEKLSGGVGAVLRHICSAHGYAAP